MNSSVSASGVTRLNSAGCLCLERLDELQARAGDGFQFFEEGGKGISFHLIFNSAAENRQKTPSQQAKALKVLCELNWNLG